MSFLDNNIIDLFSSAGANANKFPQITIKNISLFADQLYNLIIIENSEYNPNICDINLYDNTDEKLKYLFTKYGSDKGEGLYWTVYTNYMKNLKEQNIKLLEIGIGTNNPNLVSTMGNSGKYKSGGSLRAFSEYLENSEVFGADIDKNILFNENRIKTYYIDQLDISTYTNFNNFFGNIKYDIIIDDGLHSIGANLNTILFGLNNINKNGVIIIEDIPLVRINSYKIIDFIICKKNNYKTKFVTYSSGFMYIIEVN